MLNTTSTTGEPVSIAPLHSGPSFDALGLIDAIRHAVRAENYAAPTPIQAQSIPHLLAGRDLLGCAQTGTGKTAAFALPILQRLAENRRPAGTRKMRALILTPTRELASQIDDSFRTYGRNLRLSSAVIFGGVGQNPQVQALSRGLDILVATPGRLLDLMNQGHARLDGVEIFVLDEADRMLDMGFIHDVKRIIAALPAARQTLLFSATMPSDIAHLADRILSQPVRVAVAPVAATADRIDQWMLHVEKGNKRALLDSVLKDRSIARALVFTRTKHGANKVAEQLARSGVASEAIHGNKSQGARERALANFKAGRTRVLVATDIAARGIDIDGVTHVINFDLPNVPESYVHRIGRTARAGASGIAISFCDREERPYLRDIEKLIRKAIPVVDNHPFRIDPAAANGGSDSAAAQPRQGQRPSGGRPGRQRRRRR
ncbi:MAG: DEAD/DEAH box helicase [Alphaproteobacteria bacterium]|nr:DEAD/DEAH box helicase [Alphaproteobacteria bacterium]